MSALLGASCWAYAAEPVPGATLESLLEVARRNNPELAAARAEAEAAGERVQPAGALPDPVLRVELENVTNNGTTGIQLSPSRVGDTKYTLMQSLPFWGKRDLRRGVAEADASRSRLQQEMVWRDLAARIKGAYADWWLNGQVASFNQEMLILAESIQKIAETRYAAGLAPQQDVIRAQVERSNLKAENLMFDHERDTLTAVLNGLLDRPLTAPMARANALRPVPPPEKLSLDILAGKLAASSPEIAGEDARITGARTTRDLAYRERYPDFTVGIVPMQMQNSVSSWSVMLEMNLPLQQESRRSKERESERMLAAAEARKSAVAGRLRADLGNARAALHMARQTEQVLTTTLLPQAELGFRSALAGYEAGKVDFVTLLEAQKQWRQARQNLYKALANQRARLADIEKLIGEDL